MPHSGMPGAPTGPRVAEHHDGVGVDVEGGVVDAGGEVVDVLEDHRPALVRSSRRSAAEIFITAPSGHRLPRRTASEPPVRRAAPSAAGSRRRR